VIGLLYGSFGRFLESMKIQEISVLAFVPKTDTGAHAEKAKVFRIIQVREFGKLVGYLW
jgi:hypothetical protein